MINKEVDCQKVQKGQQNDMGKGKLDEKDKMLLVGSTSTQGSSSGGGGGRFGRGRGRGHRGGSRGGFRKPTGKCWNCGEKGHFKNNCPHPKKDNSPKKMDSANAAAESNSDGNGVWAVDADSNLDGLKSPLGEAWAVDQIQVRKSTAPLRKCL